MRRLSSVCVAAAVICCALATACPAEVLFDDGGRESWRNIGFVDEIATRQGCAWRDGHPARDM